MRNDPKVVVIGLALGVMGLGVGCGGGGATPTERLWVSTMPKTPREPVTAFLTMRTSEKRYLGAFFQGSMLRGQHDVFEWHDEGKDKARVHFLQDDRRATLRFESCPPDKGFHYCLLVHGDPTGAVRYQSRKRWVVKRPGKRDAAIASVPRIMVDLAEDDDELAAAIDAAVGLDGLGEPEGAAE